MEGNNNEFLIPKDTHTFLFLEYPLNMIASSRLELLSWSLHYDAPKALFQTPMSLNMVFGSFSLVGCNVLEPPYQSPATLSF